MRRRNFLPSSSPSFPRGLSLSLNGKAWCVKWPGAPKVLWTMALPKRKQDILGIWSYRVLLKLCFLPLSLLKASGNEIPVGCLFPWAWVSLYIWKSWIAYWVLWLGRHNNYKFSYVSLKSVNLIFLFWLNSNFLLCLPRNRQQLKSLVCSFRLSWAGLVYP